MSTIFNFFYIFAVLNKVASIIMKLLILVPKLTNRLQYIFEVIFKEELGIQYELTTDKDLYTSYEDAKFQYGNAQLIDGTLFQKSVGILVSGIFYSLGNNLLHTQNIKKATVSRERIYALIVFLIVTASL